MSEPLAPHCQHGSRKVNCFTSPVNHASESVAACASILNNLSCCHLHLAGIGFTLVQMRNLILGMLLAAAAPALCAAPAAPLALDRVFANPPLLGTPPRALSLAPDGRHIGWLQPRTDDQMRYDLWVEEIATGKRRMAVDSLALSSGPANLSEAELMRRERLRLASVRGLVDYQWSPDGRSILVPLDGDIWLAPLDGPPRQLTQTAETELDAKLSPKGTHASFVRNQNLFALNLANGQELQLTTAGGGAISYGVAELVAQEEMERRTGQWWAPDGQRIAAARVDESQVTTAVRAAIGSTGTKITEQRYPFAGTPNALVSLEIHKLDGSPPCRSILALTRTFISPA